jgi:hypothetical protein
MIKILAMAVLKGRWDDWEVCLETPDSEPFGFVGGCEVEPVETTPQGCKQQNKQPGISFGIPFRWHSKAAGPIELRACFLFMSRRFQGTPRRFPKMHQQKSLAQTFPE